MSKEKALIEWLLSDDTGASSKAIASHMYLGRCDGSFPWDPADIGRCFRLIAAVPEWEARLPEMAQYNDKWAKLVNRWQEIKECMEMEVGIDGRKGRSAKETSKLMAEVMWDE